MPIATSEPMRIKATVRAKIAQVGRSSNIIILLGWFTLRTPGVIRVTAIGRVCRGITAPQVIQSGHAPLVGVGGVGVLCGHGVNLSE